MFRQHVPKFIDTKQKLASSANTLEDVLAISWVKSWTKSTEHSFYMWVKIGKSLIALFDEGTYWWVVGHADFDLELPEFTDHRIHKRAEPNIIEEGIHVKSDGRAWYVLKANDAKTGYLGYRVDVDRWLGSRYTTFLSESEAQAVKDKLSGVSHGT
jgi:hypothetical protein